MNKFIKEFKYEAKINLDSGLDLFKEYATKRILTYEKKIALIFGVTGQDGSYLSRFLLKKIILSMELNEEVLV